MIGIDELEFQKNTVYHSQDRLKVMAMMQIQKNAASEKPVKLLSRQVVFDTFKVQ